MHACLCLWVCAHKCKHQQKQRLWIPMELELQEIVSLLIWAAGIELRLLEGSTHPYHLSLPDLEVYAISPYSLIIYKMISS